jgi:adenylylsulfate kinase
MPFGEKSMAQKDGYILWLLGPTSSGKTTIANNFIRKIRERGALIIQFDGDEIRNMFGSSLTFTSSDRLQVVKAIVILAKKASEAGINVVVSALTANIEAREYVRQNVPNLIMGYVYSSIEVCAKRDPKGLYKLAREGKIDTLIGLNSEYVPPENPDIILNTEKYTLSEVTEQLFVFMGKMNNSYITKTDAG